MTVTSVKTCHSFLFSGKFPGNKKEIAEIIYSIILFISFVSAMETPLILQLPLELLSLLTSFVLSDGKSFYSFRTLSKFFYEFVMNAEYTAYLEHKKKRDDAISEILYTIKYVYAGKLGGMDIKIYQMCKDTQYAHACIYIESIPIIGASGTKVKNSFSQPNLDILLENVGWNWIIYYHDSMLDLLHGGLNTICEGHCQDINDILLSHFDGVGRSEPMQWEYLVKKLEHLLKDTRLIPRLEIVVESKDMGRFAETLVPDLFQTKGVDIEVFSRLYFLKYDK